MNKCSDKEHENTNRKNGREEDESEYGRKWGRGVYKQNILLNY